MNKLTKEKFESDFGALVERGERKFYRRVQVQDYHRFDVDTTVEEVPAVTIHLTEDSFSHLLSFIPSNAAKEKTLRAEVPALAKAWEQYRLLLKMCGGDYKW